MRLVASMSKTYPFTLETFLKRELLTWKTFSDAKSVKARIGGGDSSAQASSTSLNVATTASVQGSRTPALSTAAAIPTSSAVIESTFVQTTMPQISTSLLLQTIPSPSAAIEPSGNGSKPDTIQQTLSPATASSNTPSVRPHSTMTRTSPSSSSSSTSSVSSALTRPLRSSSSTTSVVAAPTSALGSSTSAAAAQSTSGANSLTTHDGWSVRRFVNVSVLAACYLGWFMM